MMALKFCATMQFLSTPSVGRATVCSTRRKMTMKISIHALRGEGDSKSAQKFMRLLRKGNNIYDFTLFISSFYAAY